MPSHTRLQLVRFGTREGLPGFPACAIAAMSVIKDPAMNNRLEEAVSVLDHLISGNAGTIVAPFGSMMRSALRGERTDAVKSLTPASRSKLRRDKEFAWLVADCFALIDEKEEALDWLEHAVELGFINYPLLSKHDPYLENLRADERFKELMVRVKTEWERFEVDS